MQSIDNLMDLQYDTIKEIQKIDEKVTEECNKDSDDVDKEKIFKLRYQQMIKGLYLNQYGMNNF